MTSKNSISNKIKMKIDNNIFIKSLYFSEYGYGCPEEVYEYKKAKFVSRPMLEEFRRL